MITLNFGTSGYDVRDNDRIIEIPEQGRLQYLPKEYSASAFEPRKINFKPEKTERDFPAVVFSFSGNVNDSDSIIILWIQERNEWVAFHYQQWQESARGSDSYYYGPYSPDFVCEQQILLAYDKSGRFIRDVLRTSPSELEKI